MPKLNILQTTLSILFVGVLMLVATPSLTVQSQGNDDFKPTFPDVRYVEEGDYKHKVDVYLPAEAETPYPTILLFHGNGYIK